MTKRVLTGITPSGTPHLGNYVGSIRPAIRASQQPEVQSYFFLADLHALIKCQQAARVQRSTLEIAATWLACGLEPEKTHFYRQSDIPEITELFWFLTCNTGKGLLNRAHAYKAMLDKNQQANLEPDAEVTAGLFMYPVLMAADILIFKTNLVPVGRDQIQHVEMARDIANSFNYSYGEYFTLPDYLIDEKVATLPGLDGRKMSKSYNNTIPVFSTTEQLKKQIFNIVTDAKGVGQAKDPSDSALFQLYRAFANEDESQQYRQAFAAGCGWAELKQQLFVRLEQEIAPLREQYQQLMAKPQLVEEILQQGAQQLRAESQAFLSELKQAVGIRNLSLAVANTPTAAVAKGTTASYQFKQYRQKSDGLFYFKLVDTKAQTLIQSHGFSEAQHLAECIKQLQINFTQALIDWKEKLELSPELNQSAVSSYFLASQT